MIEIENLRKSFGPTDAVDGLTLTAQNGEILGLIGHNGAGKTTTFRIVAGLMRPDGGRVAVDGHDVTTNRVAAQHALGVLPDIRGLYPRLTGREHVHYYGELHGLSGEALDARIAELADRLGMGDFIDRRARGYSRGQELKVALARALVHGPKNVIFDEPTNGLDVPSARAVHAIIRELRDAGAAIIVSSHIMSEVATLCDRVLIMADGRGVMEGSPEDLKKRMGTASLEDVFIMAMSGMEAAE